MEDIEVPLEQAQEKINEEAKESRERWISMVALSSALLAVFAAMAALLAGHHANEALIKQINSSDSWSYYQAKGIKSAVVEAKLEILDKIAHQKNDEAQAKFEKYQAQQEEIKKQAEESKEESERHLKTHETFATAVTMFQIAIAVAAISVLTRRKHFWLVGLTFGGVGLWFFIQGLWH